MAVIPIGADRSRVILRRLLPKDPFQRVVLESSFTWFKMTLGVRDCRGLDHM